MTIESKTLSSFWVQSCHHYGDGLGGACHHFGDSLSSFWGRFGRSVGLPCHHFGDILNNHTPLPILCTFGDKQYGRPVDIKYRTGGQTAYQRPVAAVEVVPMPPFLRGGVVAGEPFHSTHTAGLWV